MPPFTFIENDRATAVPSVLKPWSHRGPAAQQFEPVDVLPTLVRKAVDYLDGRAHVAQPFFLYLPLTAPHAPVVPAPEWRGRGGPGARPALVPGAARGGAGGRRRRARASAPPAAARGV